MNIYYKRNLFIKNLNLKQKKHNNNYIYIYLFTINKMTDSNNIIVKSNVDDYGETSHLLLDNNTSNDYDAINEAYFEQPSVGSFMPSFGHVHYR